MVKIKPKSRIPDEEDRGCGEVDVNILLLVYTADDAESECPENTENRHQERFALFGLEAGLYSCTQKRTNVTTECQPAATVCGEAVCD